MRCSWNPYTYDAGETTECKICSQRLTPTHVLQTLFFFVQQVKEMMTPSSESSYWWGRMITTLAHKPVAKTVGDQSLIN